LNDRIYLSLARRNQGYAEPEFRLWILLPLAFVQAGALLLYGVGIYHGLPYIVPAVGMAGIGFCLVAGVSVLLSYVLDCYEHIAEEAITGVLVVRAIIATSMIFAVQPWIANSGIQNAFIAMAVIAFALFGSAGIFLKWGKNFRVWTAERYAKAKLETLS
jgi:hypothetical protein